MDTTALTSSSRGNGSFPASVASQFRWPNWVMSRRSSGWNRMMIAITTEEANVRDEPVQGVEVQELGQYRHDDDDHHSLQELDGAGVGQEPVHQVEDEGDSRTIDDVPEVFPEQLQVLGECCRRFQSFRL